MDETYIRVGGRWGSLKGRSIGISPEPLLAGDGLIALATNQAVTPEMMGLKEEEDFFFVRRDYLDANRPVLVAVLRAGMRARHINGEEPSCVTKLVIEEYGRDLGFDMLWQIRQNGVQIPYMRGSAAVGVLRGDDYLGWPDDKFGACVQTCFRNPAPCNAGYHQGWDSA